MTILNQIITYKRREEIPQRKLTLDLATLQARAASTPAPRDFTGALRTVSRAGQGRRLALIAEVKKASPSRGLLRADFDPVELAQTYASHGAAAISVLTDARYFQGSLQHLTDIRNQIVGAEPKTGGSESWVKYPGSDPQSPPLLRKDFIIDPYQVYESRAAGADALLLIAAVLSQAELAELLALTKRLGMAALVEVHDEHELERVLSFEPDLIGVNNRDLRDFSVDLNTCLRLRPLVPAQICFVAESGIHTSADLERLAQAGVDAILVGEALVKAADVAARVRALAGQDGDVWSR